MTPLFSRNALLFAANQIRICRSPHSWQQINLTKNNLVLPRPPPHNHHHHFPHTHTLSCVTACMSSPQSTFEEIMKHARLTHVAHEMMRLVLRPGDTAIDATCGNGHDTTFLAKSVGPTGRIYAFDVQESAIHSTRAAVEKEIPIGSHPAIMLERRCHSEMQAVAGSNVARAICFNLGYLPGGDKSLTTSIESTVSAVEAAFEVITSGGLISLLCYTAHPGGMEEYDAVKNLVSNLPTGYWVSTELRLLNRPSAPVLILVWRR